MTWFQWIGTAVLAWILWTNGRSTFKAMQSSDGQRLSVRTMLSAMIAIIMMAVFCYGWFKYPDAPIKPCAGSPGFCGKQGQLHTSVEYWWFAKWETTLIILWPIGLLSLFLLNRKRLKLDSGGPT